MLTGWKTTLTSDTHFLPLKQIKQQFPDSYMLSVTLADMTVVLDVTLIGMDATSYNKQECRIIIFFIINLTFIIYIIM